MTITIADGRGALWQWDTGRRVKITDGVGVKQIHYQNRCYQMATPLAPRGIMLHSIGAPQSNAAAWEV